MVHFRQFYILFFYVVGVMLYDLIPFSFLDELLVFGLLIITLYYRITNKDYQRKVGLNQFAFIALFYFVYSVLIHSNSIGAISKDLIIQSKPFIIFYCYQILNPVYSEKELLWIRIIASLFGLFLLFVGIMDKFSSPLNINLLYGHPSRFATAVVATALLYLWASKIKTIDIIVVLGLMTIGLLSGRSKFFGIYAIAMGVLLFRNSHVYKKITIKSFILVVFFLVLALIVTYDKIQFYFVEGAANLFNEDSENLSAHMFARPALYFTSFLILLDYIPFGSGLGSFATFASSSPYSEVYYKYGLNNIYGLSPEFGSFISDTYYPVLAQFGIVGVILYLAFWRNIFLKINVLRKGIDVSVVKKKDFLIGLIIVGFFTIESVADSTFTHNRGAFVMILLALVISNAKKEI